MTFAIVDYISLQAGLANEDRASYVGDYGWVVDGATDVVDEPLVGEISDAAWFADALDSVFRRHAVKHLANLGLLPSAATRELAVVFQGEARRLPLSREEHPSASAIFIRQCGEYLEYVSVGDCTMLVARNDVVRRFGNEPRPHIDVEAVNAINRFQIGRDKYNPDMFRNYVWPAVRSGRALMNLPNGYGAWSITPTPDYFIKTGTLQVGGDDFILLATDGLLRLVDMFGCHTDASLFKVAINRGLADLVTELRALEAADPHKVLHTRVKSCDDATGLLLRII